MKQLLRIWVDPVLFFKFCPSCRQAIVKREERVVRKKKKSTETRAKTGETETRNPKPNWTDLIGPGLSSGTTDAATLQGQERHL